MKIFLGFFLTVCVLQVTARKIISEKSSAGTYILSSASQNTVIYTDEANDWLVQKSAALLQLDIRAVTGKKPAIIHQLNTYQTGVFIIGNIGHSAATDKLLATGKINNNLKEE